MSGPTLEDALRWAEAGWSVHPLRVGRKEPAAAHGHRDATRDPDQIERWWSSDPGYNIGGVTAGRVVIDTDLYKPGAPEALARLEAEYGALPKTRTHRTGRDGKHRIFHGRGTPIGDRTKLVKGIDVKADGGYVVLPPSVLTGGGIYTVEVDMDPVPIPEAWERMLLLQSRSSSPAPDAGPILDGERDDRLTQIAGHLALDRSGYDQFRAALGEVNRQRCVPPLSEDEVDKIARSIWGREQAKTRFDPDHPSPEALKVLTHKRHLLWADGVIAGERASLWREPRTTLDLVEELTLPDEPLRYTVEGLHMTGGNTHLTAQFKTGKTTLMMNLARSLVDGGLFLGERAVKFPAGRVALWNYEVGEAQFRVWMREARIQHPERVAPQNLRGFSTPWLESWFVDWTVEWLVDRDVKMWILDPWARAISGSASENDNDEVGAVLDVLDEVKLRADVDDLVVASHTGRKEHDEGAEHARGATRLDDWCDSRWLLTRVGDRRFLRADGRDVEMPDRALEYDPATRRLRLGEGSRAEARADEATLKIDLAAGRIRTLLAKEPGLCSKEIRDRLKGARSEHKEAALKRLVDDGEVEVRKGPNGRHDHYLVGPQMEMGS